MWKRNGDARGLCSSVAFAAWTNWWRTRNGDEDSQRPVTYNGFITQASWSYYILAHTLKAKALCVSWTDHIVLNSFYYICVYIWFNKKVQLSLGKTRYSL